jgi:glycosyltransferase involved in cell wall biosynthesis
VIVVDDASTDESVEVIGRFAKDDPIVRLIRNERNLGVNMTVMRGLKECRGEYFTSVAADDVVTPGCLERIMRLIDRFPEAGIYFGQHRAVWPLEDGDYTEGYFYNPAGWTEERYATPESFLHDHLEVEYPGHSASPTTVYRKRCFEEVGGYRSELGYWSDSFALRAIGLKYGACYTPAVQSLIYLSRDSYSMSSFLNTRLRLDIVGRAAWLMRSPEFRDRFPEPYVARWEKISRDEIINNHLQSIREINYLKLIRGSILPRADKSLAAAPGRNSMAAVPKRNAVSEWLKSRARGALSRTMIAYHQLRLRAYAPDLSCYSSRHPTSSPASVARRVELRG